MGNLEDDLLYRPVDVDLDKERYHLDDLKYITESLNKLAENKAKKLEKDEDGIFFSIYDPWIEKMENYIRDAKLVDENSRIMMDICIEDLDTSIADAPEVVKHYHEELSNLPVNRTDKTDPSNVISKETMKCYMRTCGYYGNHTSKKLSTQKIEDIKKDTQEVLESMDFNPISFGITLLVTVIKLCFLVIIRYMYSWPCALFDLFSFKIKIPVINKEVKIPIFYQLVAYYGLMEWASLMLIGYRCRKGTGVTSSRGLPGFSRLMREIEKATDAAIDFFDDNDGPCDYPPKPNRKTVKCCTMESLLFGSDTNQSLGDEQQSVKSDFSKCLKMLVKEEMSRNGKVPNIICSDYDRDDQSIEPDLRQKSQAKAVTDYVLNKPENASRRSTHTSDISVLKNSMLYADKTEGMASSVLEKLKQNRKISDLYSKSDSDNCFGLPGANMEDRLGGNYYDPQMGREKPPSFIQEGSHVNGFMVGLDEVLSSMLGMADRGVSWVAGMMQWSNSKQLCCWVYLMTLIGTMISSLVIHNKFCSEDLAEDIRDMFRISDKIKDAKSLRMFKNILKTIITIMNSFIRQQNRKLMLAGMMFPLNDFMEELKAILLNAIAMYLDYLIAPLSMSIDALRTNDEIRRLIENECFGFAPFLDWLSCLLGLLKAKIMSSISGIFNKTFKDIVLLSDITLCRTRLTSMEGMRDLLQRILDLIDSLKDCYEPEELASKVVDKHIEDEYNNYFKTAELLGDRVEKVKTISQGVLPETQFQLTDQQREDLKLHGKMFNDFDAVDPNGMKQDFGVFLEEIVYNEIDSNYENARIWIKEDGAPLNRKEFIKKIEELTGTTVSDMKESLNYRLYNILRGEK